MTVTVDIPRWDYTGDGVLVTYPFTAEIYAATDLKVYVSDVLQSLNVDYTIDSGSIGVPAGGNVVFDAESIPAVSAPIVIILDLPLTQLVDYIEGDKFPAETHEKALDRLVKITQSLSSTLTRVAKLPVSSLIDLIFPNPTASEYLGWNAAGDNLENKAAPVVVTGTQYEVDALITYGSGTEFTKATIDAALTAVGTVNPVTVLLRPGTWVIDTDADYSTYTNVNFNIPNGAMFQIDSGVTLTISGPFNAGLYQVFDCVGTGKVVFSDNSIEGAYPEWFAAWGEGTTDDTPAIEKAFESYLTVLLQERTYRITELILESYQVILGKVPRKEYSKSTLKSISTSTNAQDALIYIYGAVSTKRTLNIKDVILQEDAAATRTYGLYAYGLASSLFNNIMTLGFDTGIYLDLAWGNAYSLFTCYFFRECGVDFGVTALNNGAELNGLHCSTDVATASHNVRFSGHTVYITDFVSEGSAISHFNVSAYCDNITLVGLHTEGTANLFMLDLDSGSPTIPYCVFNIFGGGIYITAAAGRRFIETTGSTASVGMKHLNIDGVSIRKPGAGDDLPEDYFDLERVAGFRFNGTMTYTANAHNQVLSWKNLATDIHFSFRKTYFGADGDYYGARDRIYLGSPGHYRDYTKVTSISSAAPGTYAARLALENNVWRVAIVDVITGTDQNTTNDAVNDFARFRLAISRDFSVLDSDIITDYTQGAVAAATTFSVNTVVSDAVDNGAGLVRLTATAHGQVTGGRTKVAGVTGTTEANGYWYITKIDANTFDLIGSTFANAFVGAGITTDGYLRAINATSQYYAFKTDIMESWV